MQRVAQFEKVSLATYTASAKEETYHNIVLPTRATQGSAGYDFVSPISVTLKPNEAATIPTGIRARIAPGVVLMLFPRSSLGFRYQMRLANTAGVIDSDYYFAENQGHILVRIVNGSLDQTLTIQAGERFCQGIFMPYYITEDDKADAARIGGIGSTGSV